MLLALSPAVNSLLRSSVAITSITQCVEELVHNSLDAKSTCVAVRVNVCNGWVQVVDNGTGIHRDDLKSIANRYSTSKCHEMKDLDNLCHHGYRGEALASIRDICQSLELSSRHRLDTQTFTCTFNSATPSVKITEAKAPRPTSGTTVTVTDLFSKLPVRKKRRNDALDLEQIQYSIEVVALIHPAVSFSLRNEFDGKKLLQTHKTDSSVSVFATLHGNSKSQHLRPISRKCDDFRVEGFISLESHHNKSLQFVYVNKRFVLKTKIHKLVNKLVAATLFSKRHSDSFKLSADTSPQKYSDRNAIFIINITCSLREYDITLDPAKTLVEFKNWTPLLYNVEKAVRDLFQSEGIQNVVESDVNDNPIVTEDYLMQSPGIKVATGEKTYGADISTSDLTNSLHSIAVRRPRTSKFSDIQTSTDPGLRIEDSPTPDEPSKETIASNLNVNEDPGLIEVRDTSTPGCLQSEAAQTVNSKTINSKTVNSKTINSENINSKTVNSKTVNSDTIISDTIISETIISETINIETIINSENINSEIINSETKKSRQFPSKLPYETTPSPLACLYKTSQSQSSSDVNQSESPVSSTRNDNRSDGSLTQLLGYSRKPAASEETVQRDETLISLPPPSSLNSLEAIRKAFNDRSYTPLQLRPHKPKALTPWSRIRQKLKLRSHIHFLDAESDDITSNNVSLGSDGVLQCEKLMEGFTKIRAKLSLKQSISAANSSQNSQEPSCTQSPLMGLCSEPSCTQRPLMGLCSEVDILSRSSGKDCITNADIKTSFNDNLPLANAELRRASCQNYVKTRKENSVLSVVSTDHFHMENHQLESSMYCSPSLGPRHTESRHTPSRHAASRHTPSRHTPSRHTPSRHGIPSSERDFLTTGSLLQTAQDVNFNDIQFKESNENDRGDVKVRTRNDPGDVKVRKRRACIFVHDSDDDNSPDSKMWKARMTRLAGISSINITPTYEDELKSRKTVALNTSKILKHGPEFDLQDQITDVSNTEPIRESSSRGSMPMHLMTTEYDIELVPLEELLHPTQETGEIILQDSVTNVSQFSGDRRAKRKHHRTMVHESIDHQNECTMVHESVGHQNECTMVHESIGHQNESMPKIVMTETEMKQIECVDSIGSVDENGCFLDVDENGSFLDVDVDESSSTQCFIVHTSSQEFLDISDTQLFKSQPTQDLKVSSDADDGEIIQDKDTEITRPSENRISSPRIDPVITLMESANDNKPVDHEVWSPIDSGDFDLLDEQWAVSVEHLDSIQATVEAPTSGSDLKHNKSDLVHGENSPLENENEASESAEKIQWLCQIDKQGKKFYINLKTGHTSYSEPVILNDNITQTLTLPRSHPMRQCSSSLLESFRSGQTAAPRHGDDQFLAPQSSLIMSMLGQHRQECEGHDLCKWEATDYEQVSAHFKAFDLNEMFEAWINPVNIPNEQNILNLEVGGSTRQGTVVHQNLNTCKLSKDMLRSAEVLGQLDKKFILCTMTAQKDCRMLVAVDQHAAHERIRLEKLTQDSYSDYKDGRQYHNQTMDPRILMVLTESTVRIMKAYRQQFQQLGLKFREHGDDGDSVDLVSIPTCLVQHKDMQSKRHTHVNKSIIETFIKEQTDHLTATGGIPAILPQTFLRCLASEACHGAIKFGEPLPLTECVELMVLLSQCQLPFQCAHGRPSAVPLLDLCKLQQVFPTQVINKPKLAKLSAKMRESTLNSAT